MGKLKFSIFCTGLIAEKMAATVVKMEDIELYAVAARDQKRAEIFAQKYGFQKAYGSYQQLAEDPQSDLIYIASLHSFHAEQVKLCLEHGRNVLCEKPFTVNAREAKELICLAQQKKVFLMEAVWTRFLPFVAELKRILQSGDLGKVCSLTADFGGNAMGVERIARPELAGGALLDVGVYCLTLASMLFGNTVEKSFSAASFTDTGVDGENSMILQYADGRIATLRSSVVCPYSNKAVIYCEKGRVELENFWNAQEILVYKTGRTVPEIYRTPCGISGYEYEVETAARAIAAGETECAEMPLSETLRIMEWMDQFRAEWGLRYPFES